MGTIENHQAIKRLEKRVSELEDRLEEKIDSSDIIPNLIYRLEDCLESAKDRYDKNRSDIEREEMLQTAINILKEI